MQVLNEFLLNWHSIALTTLPNQPAAQRLGILEFFIEVALRKFHNPLQLIDLKTFASNLPIKLWDFFFYSFVDNND